MPQLQRSQVEVLLISEDNQFVITKKLLYREQLLQYNLDQILTVSKFRFSGSLNSSDTEYKQLLDDFFSSSANLSSLNVSGTPAIPMQVSSEILGVGVMSMEFFDRLEEVGTKSLKLMNIIKHLLKFVHRNYWSRWENQRLF